LSTLRYVNSDELHYLRFIQSQNPNDLSDAELRPILTSLKDLTKTNNTLSSTLLITETEQNALDELELYLFTAMEYNPALADALAAFEQDAPVTIGDELAGIFANVCHIRGADDEMSAVSILKRAIFNFAFQSRPDQNRPEVLKNNALEMLRKITKLQPINSVDIGKLNLTGNHRVHVTQGKSVTTYTLGELLADYQQYYDTMTTHGHRNAQINASRGGNLQKLKRTDEKVQIGSQTRTVYVGARNKKYVRIHKQVLPLKDARKMATTSAKASAKAPAKAPAKAKKAAAAPSTTKPAKR
jgi:hypothetical protein